VGGFKGLGVMTIRAYPQVPENWQGEALPIFDAEWTKRAQTAASFIEEGSRVLDLGCGNGSLRRFLPAGCTWVGYDLRPLTPEVRSIDLDAGEFPSGHFDYVVVLGVLDWLREPRPVLEKARRAAPFLIVNDKRRRWRLHHLFRSKKSELRRLLPGTGWSIKEAIEWGQDPRRHYSVCLLS
jgi:SAM-dependent methyltransferase